MSYSYKLRSRDGYTFPARDHSGALLNSINDEPYAGDFLDGTYFMWYLDGSVHRGNDKPAVISNNGRKRWLIHGVSHRLNGPQVEDSDPEKNLFVLFDIKVSEFLHSYILKHAAHYKCPLWVSFFIHFDLISEENFYLFLNEENVWDCDLPVEWILKTCGVENESIRKALLDGNFFADDVPTFLSKIAKVTEFMEYENIEVKVS